MSARSEYARCFSHVSTWLKARIAKPLFQAGTRLFISPGREKRTVDDMALELYREDVMNLNLTVSSASIANVDFAERTDLDELNFDKAGLNWSAAAPREPLFRHSSLRGANLTKVQGLRPSDFAGADLDGAMLPATISWDGAIKVCDELAKNAGKVFTGLLAACAFGWLTVGMTRDADLLLNSGKSKLPVIDAEVPIVGFYLVAPILLVGLYIYQHLYLLRLWEAEARLPAVFPDGETIDRKTFPWLVNDFVTAHLPRLRGRRPALSWLQQWLTLLLAWGVAPVTLMLIWGRYIPRHDLIGSSIHLAVVIASALAGLTFFWLAVRALRGSGPHRSVARRAGSLIAPATAVVLCTAGGWSLWWHSHLASHKPGSAGSGPITITLQALGFQYAASLVESTLSTVPENWDGKSSQRVKGAVFPDRANLRGLRGYRAFLVNARLRETLLEGANLEQADLRHADFGPRRPYDPFSERFQGSDLRGAILTGVDLGGAYLNLCHISNADLHDAVLNDATLMRANLARTNFIGADLRRASIQGANLTEADLQFATLLRSNLRGAVLDRANLANAKLAGADLRGVHAPQIRLNSADLSSAILIAAELPGTDFRRAILTGTHLYLADLSGADLRMVIGLRQDQLDQAYTDAATLVSPPLRTRPWDRRLYLQRRKPIEVRYLPLREPVSHPH